MKQQQKINQSYNDGILTILKKTIRKDEYGTPLKTIDYVDLHKFWFRYIGVSVSEQYAALQVDTNVATRVGIRLFLEVNDEIKSNLAIKIKDKVYEIARVYHSHNKKETQLSLVEVLK